jgi:hypothetical protein
MFVTAEEFSDSKRILMHIAYKSRFRDESHIACNMQTLPSEVSMYRSGPHFLQIPGPTNVPDRVLRAMDRKTMDHRGPEFGRLGLEVLDGIRTIFQTDEPVVIFPSSGTGAWEAALVNTLSRATAF